MNTLFHDMGKLIKPIVLVECSQLEIGNEFNTTILCWKKNIQWIWVSPIYVVIAQKNPNFTSQIKQFGSDWIYLKYFFHENSELRIAGCHSLIDHKEITKCMHFFVFCGFGWILTAIFIEKIFAQTLKVQLFAIL